jgi:hypothetical protein
VVLDDSYHVVTLDRQRQLVVQRTLDFLSQTQWKPVAAGKGDSLGWLLLDESGAPEAARRCT